MAKGFNFLTKGFKASNSIFKFSLQLEIFLFDSLKQIRRSIKLKVPITEFFLFSHLNLYITRRKSEKKFFDLHETRIFYEFYLSNRPHFAEVYKRNKTTRDVGRTRESL